MSNLNSSRRHIIQGVGFKEKSEGGKKVVLGHVEKELLLICLHVTSWTAGCYVKVGELLCPVVYYKGHNNKALKVSAKKKHVMYFY